MYFGNEEEAERDPFEVFGELETTDDAAARDDFADLAEDVGESGIEAGAETETQNEFQNEFRGEFQSDFQGDFQSESQSEEPVVQEYDAQSAPQKVKTGFSWAGFLGGLAAIVWIAGAIGGPISYFGLANVMAMDPAMQAGLIALAFGPALLFWVTASAAGEALKTRRLAVTLTKLVQAARSPFEAGEADVQRLSHTVKSEIETLNEAVSTALDRLAQLETTARANAALFNEAISVSRQTTEDMSDALKRERDAMVEMTSDMRGQTETMTHAVGRQVRLMREASKLVKTEIGAAEEALETHLASFSQAATLIGDRTAEFHQAADGASHAASSLNTTMHTMLEGLSEASRLTDAARQSADQAVLAATETAGAVREISRNAIAEAKQAAQIVRSEAAAMRETALDTLAKLNEAARAAREASEESQAAADRHAASIEKRLAALASTSGMKKAPVFAQQRVIERIAHPAIAEREAEPVMAEVATLHAAANAAVARVGGSRGVAQTVRVEAEPKRLFKGFGGWGGFMSSRQDIATPLAANESSELVDFARKEPKQAPMSKPSASQTSANPAPVGHKSPSVDAELRIGALDLVSDAGVKLGEVLSASALERIALASRNGASARRRTVSELAPVAVSRVVRQMQRSEHARELAAQFRTRPDLAKSESKSESGDLVRAYLLIDAALA